MARFQVSWRRHVVILSHGITVLRSISAERARPIPGADFSAPELFDLLVVDNTKRLSNPGKTFWLGDQSANRNGMLLDRHMNVNQRSHPRNKKDFEI